MTRRHIQALTPVPVPRGQLGLWTLDPETEAAVRREEAA